MNSQIADVGSKKTINSISQLLKGTLKDLNKNAKRKLIKTIIISGGIFLINFILLSAFGTTSNRYLSSILLKQGNMFSGTLFWSIVGANIANITEKTEGLELKNLQPVIRSAFSLKKNSNKKNYSLGVIISLLLAMILGNPMLSAIMVVTFIMSLVNTYGSKLFFVFRLLGKKKDTLPPLNNIVSSTNGATFGLSIYTIVGGTSFGIGVGVALIVIFSILFIRLYKSNQKGQ